VKILVSACLLGVRCCYDGGTHPQSELIRLCGQDQEIQLIPVCPEILGGLSTPRPPAEVWEGGVHNCEGTDVTAQYQKGAAEALRLAELYGCRTAILKERSPSCGCGLIYDGTFTHTRRPGSGVTAELLLQHGIRVYGESSWQEALAEQRQG